MILCPALSRTFALSRTSMTIKERKSVALAATIIVLYLGISAS
jgi:hypothetical protein